MNSIERHGINYRKFYYFHLRKSTFSICVLFLTVFNFGYSQSPLQIKETYDFLQKPEYNFALFKFINQIKLPEHIPQFNDDDGIDDPINIDDYDASLGDRFGNVWNSFLTMFKTTGDKAYLHHFISQTYFCQQFRNDLQNPTNHPGWWQIGRFCCYNSAGDPVYFNSQEYWDGNIIWPMAEYVFKMKNDPEFLTIANEPLPLSTTLQITETYGFLKKPKYNFNLYNFISEIKLSHDSLT